MKRTRYTAVRALLVATATATAMTFGVSGAQAEQQVDGYAPQVAEAAAAALAGQADLSQAEAMRRLSSQPARITLGEQLTGKLGARAAGMWLDQANDTVVVNVLDEAAAATVRAAGAGAKLVTHTLARLESIRDTLAAAQVADTAFGIDVRANQVVVQVGKTAVGTAKLSGVLSAAGAYGTAVRVEHVDGSFGKMISGGFPILAAGGGYCSLGFSTTANTGVTAGHCTRAIPQWWDGSTGLFYGPSIHASFPGNDFGLIRNDGGLPQPGNVYLYNGTFQDIVTAAWPAQFMGICKSGATSGLTCGQVNLLWQTVCYPEGCVGDMAATNVFAAPGDSGGPWFAGAVAYGLTSGGGGGVTFFQPVVEALNAYGIWVF
ncbi:MAG TPA: S1 family peptidase [Actinophytocola sp.]|uniref:S1 family peptidase n=1 Tax=Actinophytocola sp. TaxID=1872138 RepID=UPI002DDCE257|nr:S1 family peptidase [Actinophytocola sp.]HEV2780995.1 S1 family peptidase [Actinophytocola sp.]